MVFNPKTSSNIGTIGILPPLLTGIGVFPKVVYIEFLAARYAGKSVGITTPSPP